jgi:hypothetical protein
MSGGGFHVTTQRKLERYERTGAILPPVRYFPNELTARRWMKRTGRDTLLQIEVTGDSYPLPDHKPARWTNSLVRNWTAATQPQER